MIYDQIKDFIEHCVTVYLKLFDKDCIPHSVRVQGGVNCHSISPSLV